MRGRRDENGRGNRGFCGDRRVDSLEVGKVKLVAENDCFELGEGFVYGVAENCVRSESDLGVTGNLYSAAIEHTDALTRIYANEFEGSKTAYLDDFFVQETFADGLEEMTHKS